MRILKLLGFGLLALFGFLVCVAGPLANRDPSPPPTAAAPAPAPAEQPPAPPPKPVDPAKLRAALKVAKADFKRAAGLEAKGKQQEAAATFAMAGAAAADVANQAAGSAQPLAKEALDLVSKVTDRIAAIDRAEYGRKLRTKYLDEGLDIKVRVHGKDNKRITLTFVLFNDVWVHHFQKGGNVDALASQGFERVTLSDGYDHSWTWNLKE